MYMTLKLFKTNLCQDIAEYLDFVVHQEIIPYHRRQNLI